MRAMQQVLTLIADPVKAALTPDVARSVAKLLAEAGARVGAPRWLDDRIAADIDFDGLAWDKARDLAEAWLADGGHPVDAVAQPAQGRRKKLLISDMDSTIITVECIDEIADFAGVKAQVAAITERAMRGELDFEQALRERVASLKGLPVTALERAFAERVRLTAGARTLVMTMRAHGAKTVLVSGGFTYFSGRVAEAAGFDHHQANELIEEGGRLTGTVREPILGANAKLEALDHWTAAYKLTRADALAAGDGANDLIMLTKSGLGVAFRAKPKVAAAASARVRHGDLTALLYAQGYRRSDFIED